MWSAEVTGDEPAGVLTVTSVTPAAPTGTTAVNDVSDSTVTELAGQLPKYTDIAPVSAVPLTVTTVPPAVEPVAGLTPVTAGAVADVVKWSADPVADTPAGVVTVKS